MQTHRTIQKLFSFMIQISLVIVMLGQPPVQSAQAHPANSASCTQSPSMAGLRWSQLKQELLKLSPTEDGDAITTTNVFIQDAFLQGENTELMDEFGYSLAVSGDTLVVGAQNEDSRATGINGDASSNDAKDSGAVYVFIRSGGTWRQQAYLKSSNSEACDYFGYSVAISGNTIAVGAIGESSAATGVNGNQADNSKDRSGAAYVFIRNGSTWTQQAYLKASNPDLYDDFGTSVSLSGNTLVVGSANESSAATGINGNQQDNSSVVSGAAYVFVRKNTTWSQQAYLKASNTGVANHFGRSVGISDNTIVVGAIYEASGSSGVNGSQNQSINPRNESGAAYVFVRQGTTWSQQAYLKASNPGAFYHFGWSVAISGDTIVVGSNAERGGSAGVNGNQSNQTVGGAGAAYVFARSGATWRQQAYLKSSHPMQNEEFGDSVGITGDTIVVGVPFEDYGAVDSGAAYVFTRECTNWVLRDYLKSATPHSYELLGWAVSASNGSLAIGSPFIQSGGSASSAEAQAQASSTGVDAAYVYASTIQSTVPITILGNELAIANGDSSPSTLDDTDFGFVGPDEHPTATFTIQTVGDANLALTGNPLVDISGEDADQFSVVAYPSSPVTSTASTTLTIEFNPSGNYGIRHVVVSIQSNSGTDPLFQFTLQGTYGDPNQAPNSIFIPFVNH